MDLSESLVLCVDDDPLFQRFVSLALRRTGCEVITAPNGIEACELLERINPEALVCVLIDRRMPRMDGLEFLDLLRGRDPNLSAILLTAEVDGKNLEDVVRSEACSFLEKPLTAETIRTAVVEASNLTKQRRQLTQLRDNVNRYGRYLRDTITSLPSDKKVATECFYLPKHEAGGDFFVQLDVNEGQQLVMLTDVSGHDLWSAQWSAYFHGFMSGSLQGGASVSESLMRFNVASVERAHATENLSIAVCALLFDRQAEGMTIFYAGAPLPVWITAEDGITTVEEPAGPPLGWFAECGPAELTVPSPSGGVYLWTDGIDDLARKLNASSLSVAQALLRTQEGCIPPAWIAACSDDLLVTRVFPPDLPASEDIAPLVLAYYGREQLRDIDSLQDYWENSLKIALPELGSPPLSALLLCAREAVLNALTYGCAEGGIAKFQITYQASTRTLSVRVSDPGPGHTFSIKKHLNTDQLDLVDSHRGLMLINSFATRTMSRRGGADLNMEFSLS